MNVCLCWVGTSYRASHFIQPKLSQSQLSFQDLHMDPDTGKVPNLKANTSYIDKNLTKYLHLLKGRHYRHIDFFNLFFYFHALANFVIIFWAVWLFIKSQRSGRKTSIIHFYVFILLHFESQISTSLVLTPNVTVLFLSMFWWFLCPFFLG